MINKNSPRLHILDLLRFILSVLVVFYHYLYSAAHYGLIDSYTGYIKYIYICGYLGVHVFFILSGFVILHTAIKADTRATNSTLFFIKNRIIRLWPTIMIVSVLGYIFAILIPYAEPATTLYFKEFIANFFGITLIPKVSDIFNIRPVEAAMWTLRYEISFYIIVAFILYIKKIKYIHIFIYLWICLSICRIYFNIPLLKDIPVGIICADYAPCFSIGMLIYIINNKKYTHVCGKLLDYGFLLISFMASLVFVYNQMIDFNTSKFNNISPYTAVFIYILLFFIFLFGIYKNIYNKKINLYIFYPFISYCYNFYIYIFSYNIRKKDNGYFKR